MVARLLGAKRIPVTGRTGTGEDPGDVELPGWYIEVRDRAKPLPTAWFLKAAFQALLKGTRPLVVYKIPGSGLGPVAMVRLKDLAEVLARAQRAGDPGQDPTGEVAGPGATEP